MSSFEVSQSLSLHVSKARSAEMASAWLASLVAPRGLRFRVDVLVALLVRLQFGRGEGLAPLMLRL